MSLDVIKTRVEKEEKAVGLPNGFTKVIAVSKLQPNDRVQHVLDSGHRVFGENRVQEATEKWPKFKEKYDGIELHLLGPLQRNKEQKAGVDVSDLDELLIACRRFNLPVCGLMCIPPSKEDPSKHFNSLKYLAIKENLKELSMGMSNDFETAIRSGATFIRVGSAIFGQRP